MRNAGGFFILEQTRSMKHPWLLFFLLTGLLTQARAQSPSPPDFCSCDTANAIQRLETFTRKYPDSNLSLVLNGRLAELYLARGQKKVACICLDKALRIKAKYVDCKYPPGNCVSKFLPYAGPDPTLRKFQMCIMMSQLLTAENAPRKALHYLNLADWDYLPSKGCANGAYMYQTFLTMHFADVYLSMKDTLSAMNRLFKYMMIDEAITEKVARRLKTLLLTKYSNNEVQQEIQRALARIKKYKNKPDQYPDQYVLVSLFDLTPYKEPIYGDSTKKSMKESLRYHRGLRTLYHYMPEHHSPPSCITTGPWYSINFFSLFSQHEANKIF